MILDLKKVERISKALGDPYRLKMMEILKAQKDDWTACSSIGGCIDLAQSTISHHINQLVDADLVISEKDGRYAKYRVNKEVIAAYANFLNQLSS